MTSCRRFSTLVVVDPAVVDYPSLVNSIPSEANLLVLDPSKDGVAQITQALVACGAVQSLHILSHGRSGALQLGSTWLNWQTLDRYAASLQSWAKSLAAGAEILLYGCEVAAETVGKWFVSQLKSLTGAEIAASTTLTGSSALGGDWLLEFSTAPVQTPIPFSDAARAAYPHTLAVLVTDDFRGSDVIDRSWKFGVGDAVGGVVPANPFLTARDITAPSGTGGLPGSPTGTALDPVGEGALRLTNNDQNQASFVLYDKPLLARDGLTITFEIFSYNGTGADGISFFLLDGAVSPNTAGAFGGSLGYAQKIDSAVGPVPGLEGAFAGIGFDEYGNFSSETDDGGVIVRNGSNPNGPLPDGKTPDSIAIRAGGSGFTGYQYVGGTDTLVFENGEGIDSPGATTRDPARRTVKIDVTPEGRLSVRIDGNNDGDFLDPGEENAELVDREIVSINGTPLPSFFKFGFAAGTGDSTNIHEVRNLVVTTLNDPPETSPFSRSIVPGNTVLLSGFSAVDPDVADGDSVASFTITTLPNANQGRLFLGNPASGGRLIGAGEDLTPQEIQTVFFQSTSGFGGATFTYTATDQRGASDETPAVVTLTPLTINTNRPPDTVPSSLRLLRGETALVPNLSGSDPDEPDGVVVAYRIVTLPPADQGTLFLGNPANGGTPITAGQDLTPAQIQQVFFQASSTFSGNQQFTYASIDNLGLIDPTPARVTLDLIRGTVNPVVCQPGETIRGTDGNDNIDGTPGIDRLRGLDGNDRLRGFDCNDMLDGGRGNDRLAGGAFRDVLMGRQNNDVARGNAGDDVINLGLGFDKGYGGNGNDLVYGRRGADFIKGRGGNDTLLGGRGKDRLIGGANNDFLDGQQNDDFLRGSNGNDIQNGGLGADRHRGGRQADRIVGRRGADVIWGGKGVDTLIGNRGNDRLAGHTQNDVINGGAGNDRIIGGNGEDRIRTGSGSDRITYRSALHGVDRILDFDVRFDKINLAPIFNKPEYGAADPFSAYVRLGNSSNGAVLRIDSNGDTAGGFVRLAILRAVEARDLSASNFLV
jgi:Ca2+-binding RTX toxin-like protein